MAVFKRGSIWWYEFIYAGRRIQESAKTSSKTVAKRAEEDRRRELREGVVGVDRPNQRVRPVKELIAAYVRDYKIKHESSRFLDYAAMHLTQHLGDMIAGAIDVSAVRDYQATRKEEGASNTSINLEVGVLLRALEERGDLLRSELKRKRQLKLTPPQEIGRPYAALEQDALLAAAAENQRSPHIHFALQLALNGGMRDKEIRTLKWKQIDFTKNCLTVGKSKTKESSYRDVPLNGDLQPAFEEHRAWYVKTFKELDPEWYVFPFGRRGYLDQTRHVTTLKTAWTTTRKKAGVQGRWHDTRHTVVSQLQEQGESDQTTMSIVGHVSQAMLKKYSHIGREARRQALEDMRAHRDMKREKELEEKRRLEGHLANVDTDAPKPTVN